MKSKTIGDYVDLQRGTTYKSALLDQPGPYLLGLGSIERDGGFRSDKLKTYGGPSADKLLVYPGDMYVSLKDVTQSGDLLGSIARVPSTIKVGRMTQDTVKLCFKSEIPQNYFYWLLRTPQYRQHCRSHATGTTNLGLSRDDFFSFPIPELTERRKSITALLEDVESKMVLNTQTNQTLEEMAQAIFKSWFVDFDPDKAKMNGEQPEGMDEATAALFPDQLVESELGLIPEGWNIKSIKDFGKVITGKTPPQEIDCAYSESGVPFITPTDIDSDVFVANTKRFLSESGVEAVKKNLLPEGSICVTCIGSQMGKTVIAPSVSASNQQINSIVTKKRYVRNFLFLNLRRRREEIFLIGSSGSTMPIINKSTFEKLKVVAPAEIILKTFDEIMFPLLDKIYQNAFENQMLSTLRDTLLPKLLSGEIDLEG